MLTPVGSSPSSLHACPAPADGIDQRDAAAGHDAFLDGGAGRGQRVLDAVLLLLQLDLGGSADLDHGDAAGQLGQPLLQLLAVVVGGGLLDLGLDLLDAGLDRLVVALALDDGRVVLVGHDAPRAAQVVDGGAIQLAADLLGDHLAAGQDRDVLEHGLAAIAEAGGLDGQDVDGAAQLVHHQGRQRLAIHVLGDDQQRSCLTCSIFSSTGRMSAMAEIFLSVIRM